MAINDQLSSDDLMSTTTGGGYGLQSIPTGPDSQMQQQSQLAQQIAAIQQRNLQPVQAMGQQLAGLGRWDNQQRDLLSQSYNTAAGNVNQQNAQLGQIVAAHQAQMGRSSPILPSWGSEQDISQAQTARVNRAVPYSVASQFLPQDSGTMTVNGQQMPTSRLGTASSPQTADTLLSNPKFLAILQSNPNQAHTLFGAMTNQDLGQVIQEKQAIHNEQITNAAKDINTKISAGNLRYDANGMPEVQEQNPLTGIKVWKSVNNSDPQKQLPVESALQLLNPAALSRAGQPVTAKNTMALLTLTGQRMGLQGDDLKSFVMSHAQNNQQAMTAQQARPAQSPAANPSQPSEPPTGEQDLQSIANLVHGVSQGTNQAGNVMANTMRGIAGSLGNRGVDITNLGIRGHNLLRALQGQSSMPFVPHYGPQDMYSQP